GQMQGREQVVAPVQRHPAGERHRGQPQTVQHGTEEPGVVVDVRRERTRTDDQPVDRLPWSAGRVECGVPTGDRQLDRCALGAEEAAPAPCPGCHGDGVPRRAGFQILDGGVRFLDLAQDVPGRGEEDRRSVHPSCLLFRSDCRSGEGDRGPGPRSAGVLMAEGHGPEGGRRGSARGRAVRPRGPR
ncbi:hypothetical protein STRIP9103_08599, partial [Streptomyces ipomoeae 91-03]